MSQADEMARDRIDFQLEQPLPGEDISQIDSSDFLSDYTDLMNMGG